MSYYEPNPGDYDVPQYEEDLPPQHKRSRYDAPGAYLPLRSDTYGVGISQHSYQGSNLSAHDNEGYEYSRQMDEVNRRYGIHRDVEERRSHHTLSHLQSFRDPSERVPQSYTDPFYNEPQLHFDEHSHFSDAARSNRRTKPTRPLHLSPPQVSVTRRTYYEEVQVNRQSDFQRAMQQLSANENEGRGLYEPPANNHPGSHMNMNMSRQSPLRNQPIANPEAEHKKDASHLLLDQLDLMSPDEKLKMMAIYKILTLDKGSTPIKQEQNEVYRSLPVRKEERSSVFNAETSQPVKHYQAAERNQASYEQVLSARHRGGNQSEHDLQSVPTDPTMRQLTSRDELIQNTYKPPDKLFTPDDNVDHSMIQIPGLDHVAKSAQTVIPERPAPVIPGLDAHANDDAVIQESKVSSGSTVFERLLNSLQRQYTRSQIQNQHDEKLDKLSSTVEGDRGRPISRSLKSRHCRGNSSRSQSPKMASSNHLRLSHDDYPNVHMPIQRKSSSPSNSQGIYNLTSLSSPTDEGHKSNLVKERLLRKSRTPPRPTEIRPRSRSDSRHRLKRERSCSNHRSRDGRHSRSSSLLSKKRSRSPTPVRNTSGRSRSRSDSRRLSYKNKSHSNSRSKGNRSRDNLSLRKSQTPPKGAKRRSRSTSVHRHTLHEMRSRSRSRTKGSRSRRSLSPIKKRSSRRSPSQSRNTRRRSRSRSESRRLSRRNRSRSTSRSRTHLAKTNSSSRRSRTPIRSKRQRTRSRSDSRRLSRRNRSRSDSGSKRSSTQRDKQSTQSHNRKTYQRDVHDSKSDARKNLLSVTNQPKKSIPSMYRHGNTSNATIDSRQIKTHTGKEVKPVTFKVTTFGKTQGVIQLENLNVTKVLQDPDRHEMKSNDKSPDSAPLKSSDSWVQHFKPNVSEQSAHGHKSGKSISGITVDMLMGVQPTYFDNETQKYPPASTQPVSNHQRGTSQKADGGESTLASLSDKSLDTVADRAVATHSSSEVKIKNLSEPKVEPKPPSIPTTSSKIDTTEQETAKKGECGYQT